MAYPVTAAAMALSLTTGRDPSGQRLSYGMQPRQQGRLGGGASAVMAAKGTQMDQGDIAGVPLAIWPLGGLDGSTGYMIAVPPVTMAAKRA
jgi:hypothetical protein